VSGRIRLARGLVQVGAFIQSLAVAVMRPADLVEFSRQSYARPENVEAWSEESLIDSGLNDDERELLTQVSGTGDLLLVGLGGGREAIPLARMGFRVTGVDYIAATVERAKENAARRGLKIEGSVQEISKLEVQENAYDVVWLSRAMYSCVPTRFRRVAMVQRIASALRPGGLFLCQFLWCATPRQRVKAEFLRRVIGVISLGNMSYEKGDRLWSNMEFVHEFSTEQTIRSEIEEGGLSVLDIRTSSLTNRGSAVCRKD
jgi:2-polyprenyl-3-methyl-5-hydroxy-6-metoxy-1,4-benzoquinol methylase